MNIKLFFSILIISTLIACNKNEPCGNFRNVNFIENYGSLSLDFTYDQGDTDFLSLEYGPSGFNLGTGTNMDIAGCCGVLIEDLEFPGTYDFYFKGACEDATWEGPFTHTLEFSPCAKPTLLTTLSDGIKRYRLSWFFESGAPFNPQIFELEYGERDFELGTGTNVVVNNAPFDGGIFEQGKIYDFYVKSDCSGVADSPWVGPGTFVAEIPQNQCLVPIDLVATDPPGDTRVKITFNGQGDCKWEGYISSSSSTPPDNPGGDIFTSEDWEFGFNDFTGSTITIGYTFFIRTVCPDGSKSAWSEGVAILV